MAKNPPHNPRNEKPVSLHPLTTDEALRHVLNVKKSDVDAADKAERAEQERKAKARKTKK